MADFMIRFLVCNVFLSGIIGILLLIKRLLKHTLSSRLQYHLWFLLLGLCAVPFLPLRLNGLPQLLSRIGRPETSPAASLAAIRTAGTAFSGNADWMNDLVLSVNSRTPVAGYILAGIWLAGIFVMLFLMFRSALRLQTLKKSALPLQNAEIRNLYERCCREAKIHKPIPVYSTAFLKSPIMVGLFQPAIYLPLHLISDYREGDMRYMLLHELFHYKHRDGLSGVLMNLCGVVYWFHPLVWYALKEMRSDREIACDTAVLKLLEPKDYAEYGNTLINAAEKVSLTPFPFAASLGGTMKEMKRRILNIASYRKPTMRKKVAGLFCFALISTCLLGSAPLVSTWAADSERYLWDSSSLQVSQADYAQYFGDYDGSFVLYDLKNDAWKISNPDAAARRVAPNSTYKIYDALFGLEEGVITPEHSLLSWDGSNYPYESWNQDQTLDSAMRDSVNWYFEAINERLGETSVRRLIRQIGYGNEDLSGDASAFWLESSLKISPVEQVELLTRLYTDGLGFSSEHVRTVLDSIRLSSSEDGTLYGKTGTGRVDGQDVNGWFVGFFENSDNAFFFAANIRGDQNAAGSSAAQITVSILSDMGFSV